MCSCYSFLLTPTHPIDCQGSVFAVCPLPTIQAELAEDVNHQPKLRRKDGPKLLRRSDLGGSQGLDVDVRGQARQGHNGETHVLPAEMQNPLIQS